MASLKSKHTQKCFKSSLAVTGFVFLIVSLLSAGEASAQCACSSSRNWNTIVGINNWSVGQSGGYWVSTGQFFVIESTVNGAVYRISTSGCGYDSQLTIYDWSTNTYLGYNDDNGPAVSGTASSIDYTGNSSYPHIKVMLNQYNCQSTSINTYVTVTLMGVQSPAPANPSSVSVSSNPICYGSGTQLTANGAVGTVYWYSGSCGGTFVSTGNPITVYPGSTTTYYARNYNNGSFSSGCASAAVTVNPSSVGGTVSGGTTVCTGSNSTTLTLSGQTGNVTKWQSSSVSNFSSGISDIASTSTSLTVSNLTSTTYYRAIVTSGVCSSANSSVATITVSSAAVGGAIAGSSSVCAGSNSTLFTLSGYTGTISKWQSSSVSNFGSGVTDIANTSATFTAINLSGTTYYRAVITSGACTSYSSTGTVTVSPVSVGGSISGSATVCYGTNNTTLTLSGFTGSITKWQSSSVSNFASSVTDIASTSATLTVSNLVETTYFRAVVSSGVCSSANSGIATVTVTPASVGGTATATLPSLCTGNSTTINLTGNTGTIQWQQSANGTTGWASATGGSGAATAVYTTPNLSATTYYRAMVTNGVCSSTTSTTAQVTVNPLSGGGTIAGGTSVCTGTNSTTLTLSGYTGNITKWQSSTVSNFSSNVTDINNTTATCIASNLSETTYYRAAVKSGECSLSYSPAATISVNPLSAGGTIAGTTTVCSGANSTTLTLNGSTGAVTRWESSPNSDFSSSVTTIANTTTSLTAANLTATTFYRAVVTSSPCSSAYSSTASITVNPTSVGGTISGGTSVCTGTNSTTLTLSGYTGTIQWQSSTNNVTFTNLTGQTNPTYTASNLSVTTYYRAILTSGICSSVYSAKATITVSPVSAGGSVSGGTTVCSGSNTTVLSLNGYTGSITKWQSSTVSDFSANVTDIANITASLSAVNLTTTTYYRAVVTSGACSIANSTSASIVVSPAATGGTVSGGTTVCSGTNSTTLTLNGSSGTIQWQSSLNNSTFTNISGATASTYTASNLTATTYYRAVVTSGVCVVNSSSATITVTPLPVVAALTGVTSVCPGESTTLICATSGGVWTSSNVSLATVNAGIVTGVSAGTPSISYTVASAGCSATVSTTVTVNASLAAPSPVTATPAIIQTGGNSDLNAISTGNTISWYNASSGGTLLATTASGADYNVTPSFTTTYYAGTSVSKSFYINSLTTSNSYTTDHNATTGDDRGGIAVTQSYYYYTGDTKTVRYDMPGLTNPVAVTRRDGIFSDLSGSGTVYTLWNGSSDPVYGSNTTAFIVTSFKTLNNDLSLGSTTINLSAPVTMQQSSSAIYSGSGFVILQNGSAFYRVDLPTGNVTSLGSFSTSRYNSESWATWGVAELNNGVYSILYRDSSSSAIKRVNLSTSAVTTAATFSNLSDMACFTHAPWYNRWYFHYEGSSQFGGSSETAGYADGTHTSVNTGGCPSTSRTPVTVTIQNIPTVTTTAVSAINATIATSGGNVTGENGSAVSARGVCWSTSTGPTVNLATKTSDSNGPGSFVSNITGLNAGTTYYVRAYATNGIGTAYGSEVSFTTFAPGSVAGTQEVCSGSTPAIFTSVSGAIGMPGVTYHWQSSTDNINFSDINGATGATYQAGTVSSATYYRRNAVSGGITLSSNVIIVSMSAGVPAPASVTATPPEILLGSGSKLNATSAGNNIKWYDDAASGTLLSTVASGADFTVTPTVTSTYYAQSAPINCTDNNLETILTNLTANNANILNQIPGKYNFDMDGPAGVNSTYINDGGSDMYDAGNYLSTNVNSIGYHDNSVISTNKFGNNGRYFTKSLSGLFVLAADLDNVSWFKVSGNYGTDGGGSSSSTTFSITVGCKTFNCFLSRVYNTTDPSINELFIIPANPSASHTPIANTNDSYHSLNGLSASTRMFYLLYAGTNGSLISDASAQNIATAFLTQTQAVISGAGGCPSAERTAVTVTVSRLPVLTTTAVSSIGSTTASSGGNISNDGGSAVTERGICWNTTANPTTALATKTTSGSGTGTFTSGMTGLTAGTIYYVRAYATNGLGTAYGDQVSFSPFTLGSFPSINKTLGDPAFTVVSPGSASPGAFTYSSSNTSVATVSGNTVTILAAGTSTITATQSAYGAYLGATTTALLTVGKASQTITFSSISAKTFDVGTFTVSATASSGLPVTFTSSNTGVATVSGTTVTITGAGSCTIYANQAGNANYLAAPQAGQTLAVSKAGQAIVFDPLSAKNYGDPSFALTATGGASGNPVVYTSSDPTKATISGNTVTIVGTGTCTITANQAGNANYTAAAPVSQTLTIGKKAQVITFAALPQKSYGDVFTVYATGGASGNPVVFTSSDPAVATCSGTNGSTVTVLKTGNCKIYANQAGNGNYSSATQVEQTLTISTISQIITFNALDARTYGDAPFSLTATASSGLSVAYSSSNTAVATVSGSTVTILSAGTATITASQPGDSNYDAAPSRDQVLTVRKANQVITLVVPGDHPLNYFTGSNIATVSATSSSGLEVTASIATGSTANIATLTKAGPGDYRLTDVLATGTIVIEAVQAGNDNYNAATAVTQSFDVTKNNQTITFGTLASRVYGDADFNLTATASSALAVSYTSSNTAVATISGGTVHIVGAGTCEITASQSGNGSYNPAPVQSQVLTVRKATPVISFANIAKTYGNAAFGLSASSAGTGSFTYRSGNETVATISGSTVTILNAGSSTITAIQAADANYTETSATAVLTVSKANQTISLGSFASPITVPAFVASPVQVTASSTSGLTVALTLDNETLATINSAGQIVSKGLAGTINVYANQPGDDNYHAAIQATGSFDVGKAGQTITFGVLAAKTYGNQPFELTATSSSWLPVSYASSNTSVATVSGSTLTILAPGSVEITASQAGNDAFDAATSVVRTLNVGKATPVVTLADIFKNYGDASFTINASSAGTGAFTYASSDPSVATVTGNTVSIQHVGTTTITVTQAEDDNYNSASATAMLTISKGSQTITFGALSAKTFNDAPFDLAATAGSGLPVTYASSNPSVATVSGSTVTIVGAGTATITATQAGDDNWYPAANVNQLLTAGKAAPALSNFGNITKTYGDPDFTLGAASTSPGSISYTSGNTSVATINGNAVTVTGVGTSTLTASQEETDNYQSGSTTATLTVNKLNQVIAFDALTPGYAGDPAFDLIATASSNLLVSFAGSNPAVATISGKTVTIVGSGTTVITASQAGNDYYYAAPAVTQNLVISYAVPTITDFAPLSACQGATVTINGTYLNGATAVSFGGTAAVSFTVVSPTRITAVAGSGTTGSVSVTTPGGTATLDGISVYPSSATGVAAAAASSICAGTAAVITLASNTGSIQWQKFDPLVSDWADIAGESGATLTTPALSAGSYQYRAVVTSGVCSSVTSNTVTIQVDPVSAGGTTSTSTPTICSGATAKINLTGQTGTIQWQKSPDGTNGWADIAGAVSDSYTTAALIAPAYYRAVVTSGVCSLAYSNVTGVQIDPVSVGGTASASPSTICSGSTSTISLAGNTGTIQWQKYDDSLAEWTDLAGATSAGYTTPSLTEAARYRARATSGVCSVSYSNEIQVSIDPVTVAGTASSAVGTVCTGLGTTLTLSGQTGTIQWQQSANGTTGWANVTGGSGGNSSTYTTPGLTVVTYYRALVTSGVCSASTSNVLAVQVDPVSATGAASVAESVICAGNSAILSLASSTGNVQWQESEDGLAGWADISGATSSGFTTQVLNGGTFHYRAVVTSGVCSSVSSNVVHVTVNPVSILGGSVSGPGVITYGESTGILTLSGNTGTIQKWQRKYGSGSWTDIASTSATYTESPAAAGTWYYRAVVVSGACSSANSQELSITVNPKELTVTSAAVTAKVYDGNASAVVSGAQLSGSINADDVVLGNSTSGTFSSPNRGTGITVTTAMTISGTNAGNYYLTQPSLTGNITAKPLTVTGAVVATKVYDKTNSATLSGATLSGIVGSDDVSLANATTGTFAQVTPGTGIVVSTAPMILTGTASNNYSLTQPALTGTITTKTVTVTGLTANDKVYNKTSPATLSGTASLVGIVSGDLVSLTGTPVANFVTVGAGNSIAVQVTGYSLGNTDASNYTLAAVTLSASITPKPLNVISAAVTEKVYDGNTNAAVTGAVLSGIETGDEVVLDNKTTGTFAQVTVGSGIPVSTAMTISGADAANYSINQPVITGSIVAKGLTVTGAVVTTKTYDGNDHAVIENAALSGIVGADNVYLISHTTGTFAQSGAGTGISVATAPMQLAGPAAANYALTQPVLTGTITRKDLTITAMDQTKVYGTLFTFDLTSSSDDYIVSGLEPVDAISSISLLSGGTAVSATVGSSPYVITPGSATGTGLGNYNISYIAGSFAVTRADLAIFAKNETKIYGDLNTYSGTEFIANGMLYNSDAVTAVTLTSTGDPVTADVGTYPIVPSAATGTGLGNYTITYSQATLTVGKATLTVTAEAKAKVYGDANPALTYVYSGWKNGPETIDTPPAITTTANLLTPVGTHTGVITVAAASDNNYDFTYAAGNMTVTKSMITVKADPKTKVYGSPNPVLTFKYTGWKNGEDQTVLTTLPVAATTVTVTTDAGYYTGAITLAGAADENYAFTYATGDFTVTKATLTVTADAKTKVYGDANPVLTFSYYGWENGDDENGIDSLPIIRTSVNEHTPVGNYLNDIVLSAGDDNNYEFVFVPATFSVTKAMLTVAADPKTKAYGPNPVLTFTYSGWKNLDNAAVLTKVPAIATSVTAATPVGVYPNTILVSGGADENYSFTYVPASFTVTRALLTVTADAKTKVYGDANPQLTFSYSGWQNGENESVLDTKPVIATSVVQSSYAGKFANAVTISGGVDDFYSFSYVPADFTVTPKSVSPKVTVADKCFDGNTVAAVTGKTLAGVIAPDEVTLVVAAAGFDSPAPGTTKEVTATGLTLSGSQASNYVLEATAVKTVAAIFEVPLSPVTGPASVCAGSGGYVYSVEAGMSEYTWQISSGGNIIAGAGTNSVTVFWSNVGEQTLKVSYTNKNGCKATVPASYSVTVNYLPPPSISGPSTVCTSSGNVIYSTEPGMATYEWTVSSGGMIVSGKGTNAIEVRWDAAGNQTVSVNFKNQLGCRANTPAVKDIRVNQMPSTPAISAVGGTLVSSATTGNQWYFSTNEQGAGTEIPGANGQSVTAIQSGWYWVQVTQNGCTSEPSGEVYRLKAGSDNVYSVYPVPNNGLFTVEIKTAGPEEFVIQVYDQLAQKIFELPGLMVNGVLRQEITLWNAPTGIYSVVLRSKTGDIEMKKFNVFK